MTPPTTKPSAVAPPTALFLTGAGSHVVVELSGSRVEDLNSALRTAWQRCLTPEGSASASGVPRIRISLRASHEHPEPGIDLTSQCLGALMPAATQAITRSYIASQTGTHLMFHAGALAHPLTNRALVLVAPGGTGKTTLTRTLGTRYRYLTDETVAVDTDGRALPYPKPLSIRTPGRLHKVETSPDELGLLADAGPAPVARVLILDRSEHHSAPHIEQMDLFDAVMELAPQTSALAALDAGLHRLAGLIGATGPVLKVHYRDAGSLAPLVADLIGEA